MPRCMKLHQSLGIFILSSSCLNILTSLLLVAALRYCYLFERSAVMSYDIIDTFSCVEAFMWQYDNSGAVDIDTIYRDNDRSFKNNVKPFDYMPE